MSFVKRIIQVTFIKHVGGFTGSGGKNKLVVTGLRCGVDISQPGLPGMGLLQMGIWGLTLSQINDLSTLGLTIIAENKNKVQVDVGDSSSTQLNTVFTGTIYQCWGDFTQQQDACMRVAAQVGMDATTQPANPTSASGPVDPVVLLQTLCDQIPLSFVNQGVGGIRITDPYLPSNPLEQIKALLTQASINGVIENGTLYIWPKSGYRTAPNIPEIGAGSGMVGYPTYNPTGINVRCEYNPSIMFGSLVTVKSSLAGTGNKWKVIGLSHNLQCETPGGAWFTDLKLIPPDLFTAVA